VELLERLESALADRYTIERELGRGGMAVVYLAHDQKLGRDVALKVLRPELAASLGSERFLREIEIAAKLTHPNILALYDCGRIGGWADGRLVDTEEPPTAKPPDRLSASGSSAEFLYYTMPLVEGESLRDRLNREKQLPIDDALQITGQVADALGHAHSLGIVHRDIKPENILFTAGHAVVSDFGIARAVTEAGAATLTETGLAVGTPAYMSPEQASGSKDIDARSDLYSLGCVLYEMLSGETPYLGNTPQAIVAKKLSEPAPRVSVVRDKVPPAVEAALDRALSRTPADRFATAEQFTSALTSPSRVVAPGSRRRRFARWAALGASVATMTIVAIVLTQNRTPESATSSIALLPCANVTRDTAQDWLVDSWTDELTASLGQLSTLIVRPFASVQQYKDGTVSREEIGTALAVDYLADCRIALRGDTVALHVAVSSVEPEAVIWSRPYERVLDEGAAYNDFQAVVAQDVAAALGADVTGTSREQLAARGTSDTVALRLYRQAQTAEGWRARMWLLEQAIASDPAFVLPYVELAGIYHGPVARDSLPPRQAYHVMDTLLTRALTLDSLYPDALGWQALLVLEWERDWPRARALFERAISLGPNSPAIREMFSHALGTVGLVREAIEQQDRAQELDPTRSPAYLGHAYVRAGQFREAVALMRRRLAAVPDDPEAKLPLGFALTQLGEHDEAIELLEEVDQAWGQNITLGCLGYAYGRAGRRDAAEAVLTELRRRGSQRYVTPWLPAMVEIGLDRRDAALDLLEQAVEDGGEGGLYALGPNPWFDPLRADPRFRELRQRVGVYVDEP